MNILGMDPGAGGGLALLGDAGKWIMFACRMPMVSPEVGKPIVDVEQLWRYLDDETIDRAVIERVHSMPRQGVASAFQFGRTTGAAEAVVQLQTAATVSWVEPAKWKRDLKLPRDKGAALEMAASLWPGTVDWSVKANDGIAEAALMALWDHRRLTSSA